MGFGLPLSIEFVSQMRVTTPMVVAPFVVVGHVQTDPVTENAAPALAETHAPQAPVDEFNARAPLRRPLWLHTFLLRPS